jgi:hypothetical protein
MGDHALNGVFVIVNGDYDAGFHADGVWRVID